MSYAFETKNLAKYFGKVKALDGVTIQAEQGKIFGLLGPNGAGKTTIIRVLSTLLQPDKGVAKVHGIDVMKDPERVRQTIGLAGQYAAVDEYLSGYENVYMTARLYGLDRRESKKRTKELLERLNLTEAGNNPVRTYSGGMRRKLDLGASLVGEPKILFLDEPTTGLDPQTRIDIWQMMRELVHEGTTILLTTQYLDEADELADKITVIDKGRVIADGTSNQLKTRLGGDIVEFAIDKIKDKDAAIRSIEKYAKQKPSFDEDSLSLRIPVKDGSKSLMKIVQALNDSKLEVSNISLHRPSLDDVFLALTGNKTKDIPEQKRRKK